jgi:hypothetical protein
MVHYNQHDTWTSRLSYCRSPGRWRCWHINRIVFNLPSYCFTRLDSDNVPHVYTITHKTNGCLRRTYTFGWNEFQLTASSEWRLEFKCPYSLGVELPTQNQWSPIICDFRWDVHSKTPEKYVQKYNDHMFSLIFATAFDTSKSLLFRSFVACLHTQPISYCTNVRKTMSLRHPSLCRILNTLLL